MQLNGDNSLEALAGRLGFEFRSNIPEDVVPPDSPIRGDFSRLLGSWGRQMKTIPLAIDNDELLIATSDPLNIDAIDCISNCYEKPARIIIVPETEIIRVINSVRTTLMSSRSSSLGMEQREDDEVSSSLKIDLTDAEDDDAPIIRYVNTLIFRAASESASDIHIEPYENVLKVRFRVDGILREVDTEDRTHQAAILSRVKVMANLNIAEKRLPQDGRIGLRIAGQDLDIRVSTVPTRYGERIVMRLLDKSKGILDLTSIGLHRENRLTIERLIKKSHGIILVTGPTGSGKTTTLYTCLASINSEDKNILTVEDPVEYELPGIGQMQVNPKIDFTFASGLRSILRQDPDVIMVGEIRDLDTVEIAIQASLTGHLVFSTLHTNDAPGAITRLLDMGVEPFLISSSLLVVIAQRLVRTLCPECKVRTVPTTEQLREIGLGDDASAKFKFYTASENGCSLCQRSGYKGRTSIHEILLIDDNVRSAIMQRADASHIRSRAQGMLSLRQDGAIKVTNGITSISEIIRVTQEDNTE
ncbi:MAG: type II secretion system ATPase GspE [bacterium]|nr:type II secretion system ATPase GspE [bacterium]